MQADKRKAVFNNQELSLMKMDGLKLIAERNMVQNIPLTYQVDTHDRSLETYGQKTQHVITAPIRQTRIVREVAKTQPIVTKTTYIKSGLRERLQQLKQQNNSLMHKSHANQQELNGLGNRFREVTMEHQNHILNLRGRNTYSQRDLDIVNEELGYFQFKNRQNFLQQSTLDRTLSHNMQNDMIDYQLHYLDNYHGANKFTSNALISQIEQSGLQNAIIIPEKKVIRKHQQSTVIEEPVRQKSFNTRKNMLQNRYTDEIPIRIEKISKSRDNKTSILTREYKHSDHVKVILAQNDDIVEVPDTQRVDNTNISKLIHESVLRKSSANLM